jgi:hypothetical protein
MWILIIRATNINANTTSILVAPTRTTKTEPRRDPINHHQSMSLFPVVPNPSTRTTMLASHPPNTTITIKSPHNIHHPSIDRTHLSALLTSFLTHMFAPASCQACTSSNPCWTNTSANEYKAEIKVDNESALAEEIEVDGGPICREDTIESWKTTKERKRRSSVHHFGE